MGFVSPNESEGPSFGATPLASMSESEAAGFLHSFLEDGSRFMPGLNAWAAQRGVEANFDLSTLPAVLAALSKEISFEPRQPNVVERALPALHKGTELEIARESRDAVVTLAYYLGATFVESFSERLRWGLGDRETVHANQPAVVGFRHELEIAVAPVSRNVLLQIAERQQDPTQRFSDFVSHWAALVE